MTLAQLANSHCGRMAHQAPVGRTHALGNQLAKDQTFLTMNPHCSNHQAGDAKNQLCRLLIKTRGFASNLGLCDIQYVVQRADCCSTRA